MSRRKKKTDAEIRFEHIDTLAEHIASVIDSEKGNEVEILSRVILHLNLSVGQLFGILARLRSYETGRP
jgi:hypothetical protein